MQIDPYSAASFGSMIRDRVRMDAYYRALQQVIRPDTVMLDIGTGTGIFALLACQLGARHVYAIEPNEAIQVGRESAAENGWSDRITFLQDVSTKIALPEKANVLIADIRGTLPLHGSIVQTFADARDRLLAPGSAILPQRDTIFVAGITAPQRYTERVLEPWTQNPWQIKMEHAQQAALNTPIQAFVAESEIALSPQIWNVLDYTQCVEFNWSQTVLWRIERPTTLHFLTMWFDTTLGNGIGFSNKPGASPEVKSYGHLLFPTRIPVELASGEQVEARIAANFVGADYIWRWGIKVSSPAQTGRIRYRSEQSTWYSEPLSLARIRNGAQTT